MTEKKRSASAINKKNKRDGTAYESAVVNYFRDRGFEADRLRLSGKDDEGDIVVRDKVGAVAIVEAKAGVNIRPRHWFDEEAVPEAKRYADRRSLLEPPMPALAMKSHNKPVGKSLVTITLEDYVTLLGGHA